MRKTPYLSYINRELPEGCKMCVQGRKLVLFITGVCPRSCYFCPLSEQKFHKDVMYANERPVSSMNDIVEEARVSGAWGCGITGGDPLARFERTVEAIKTLKAEFGRQFHIHLYTPLELVDEEKLLALEETGLDEIRFHPDLDDDALWDKLKIETSMTKGIEIPCIPHKNIARLVSFAKDYVSFINLNELEYADAKQNKLAEMGFTTRDDYSYGIKGSEELAFSVMRKFPSTEVHYCTTRLKDGVQFTNRLKIRAKNIKRPFDIVNGTTLIRGAIYGDGDVEKMHDKVRQLCPTEIDAPRNRLLCSRAAVRKHAQSLKSLGYKPVVVEELASYDLMEIESEEL